MHTFDGRVLFDHAKIQSQKDIRIECDDLDCYVVFVGGKMFRADGNICIIPDSAFMKGKNIIRVTTKKGKSLIPIESIVKSGGYIYPSGITNKSYVINLYKRCQDLAALNEKLENELEEHNKHEAFTDDIFDIG